MATLNIRNLPEDVHRKLRVRAARAGRSMEAEAREILSAAVRREPGAGRPEDLQDFVARLYGGRPPSHVVDEFLAERRKEAELE